MCGLLGSSFYSLLKTNAGWIALHHLMQPGLILNRLIAIPLFKFVPELDNIPGICDLLFVLCQFTAGWIISRPFKWIEEYREYRRKKKKPSVPEEL